MGLWRKRPVQLCTSLTSVGGAPPCTDSSHFIIQSLKLIFFLHLTFCPLNVIFSPFVYLYISLSIQNYQEFT